MVYNIVLATTIEQCESALSTHAGKLSHVRLFATPWSVAHPPPLSTGFSRQEYWSGLPFLTPGDLPDPRIEPMSPMLPEDSLPLCNLGSP